MLFAGRGRRAGCLSRFFSLRHRVHTHTDGWMEGIRNPATHSDLSGAASIHPVRSEKGRKKAIRKCISAAAITSADDPRCDCLKYYSRAPAISLRSGGYHLSAAAINKEWGRLNAFKKMPAGLLRARGENGGFRAEGHSSGWFRAT